jgi:hypothetical protein
LFASGVNQLPEESKLLGWKATGMLTETFSDAAGKLQERRRWEEL